VHGVEDGFSVGVYPGGWPEPGAAGPDEDLPVAVFDVAVVVAAEQHSVVLVGAAAVDPAKDVMCLAPRKRTVTTWPGAAAVPYFEGGAGGAGEQPPGPAQVDHGPFLVKEAGEDLGVAAKVGAQARGDRVSVIESSGAGPVLQ